MKIEILKIKLKEVIRFLKSIKLTNYFEIFYNKNLPYLIKANKFLFISHRNLDKIALNKEENLLNKIFCS